MPNKPRVAIIYGFAEGSWHGRRLRKSLRQNGFAISHNPKSADIIIAHSAGCYLIPHDTQAKLTLHAGYTYWPNRKLLHSLQDNLRLERKEHGFSKWLVRCAINDIYMLNVLQTVRMVRGWRDPGSFLDGLPAGRHIFVRPQYDSYCEPNQLMLRTNQRNTYISIAAGNHNNIWDNPTEYVNLLQSLT